MDLLLLCLNFLKTGLLAFGGGLATLPFLSDMSARHPEWFTQADLANFVAVSESTPGPLGVNMATYVGYHTHGLPGAILCTLSLTLPSFIIILIISGFWMKFKSDARVERVFCGLRPAAVGLILAAGFSVFLIAVFPGFSGNIIKNFAELPKLFDWKCLVIFLAGVAALCTPKVKKMHPVLFIAIAAAIGIIFKI